MKTNIKKVKNGIYNIKDWYIVKVKCYWYLLSNKEYQKNKNDLEKFIKSVAIDKFTSKKQLIFTFKNETFYKYIFE